MHGKYWNLSFVTSVLLCLSLLMFSCEFLDTLFPPEQIPFGGKNRRLLFIYDTDYTFSQDFRFFLEKREYSLDIIHISDVTFTDLSSYAVLISGPDTGSGGVWGTTDDVSGIMSSGRPVIGISEGGASLFQALSLSIGVADRSSFSDGTLYVTDEQYPIFNEPDAIDIPSTQILDLCMNSSVIGIDEQMLDPSVILYGRIVDSQTHYTLLKEDRFFYWGYSSSPKQMTETGKDLFSNVVHFLNVD